MNEQSKEQQDFQQQIDALSTRLNKLEGMKRYLDDQAKQRQVQSAKKSKQTKSTKKSTRKGQR